MEPLPEATQAAYNYEKSTWSTGSVQDDPFYSTTDENSGSAAPGTLLKVEKHTDVAKYSLPPGIGLSRLVYQSRTLKGNLVPVSACVLWPYVPRSSEDGYQVVAWAHGTSGLRADGAPSHLKGIWQHFLGPFNLALQGYVVVCTDYAGLGVSKTAAGAEILHEFMAFPAHAHDVFYSVQAAQQAFSEFSKQFVIVGQSQGGAAAWAAAQRQATEPVLGYLGAAAIAPATKMLEESEMQSQALTMGASDALPTVDPNFEKSDIFTDAALKRVPLVHEVGGNIGTSMTLFLKEPMLRDGWRQNKALHNFQELTCNGGKPIGGPLLIVHGERDQQLDVKVCKAAAEATIAKYPQSHIEYVQLSTLGHISVITGSQPIWMNWIAQRFAKIPTMEGLKCSDIRPPAVVEGHHAELNWKIAPATAFFELL